MGLLLHLSIASKLLLLSKSICQSYCINFQLQILQSCFIPTVLLSTPRVEALRFTLSDICLLRLMKDLAGCNFLLSIKGITDSEIILSLKAWASIAMPQKPVTTKKNVRMPQSTWSVYQDCYQLSVQSCQGQSSAKTTDMSMNLMDFMSHGGRVLRYRGLG